MMSVLRIFDEACQTLKARNREPQNRIPRPQRRACRHPVPWLLTPTRDSPAPSTPRQTSELQLLNANSWISKPYIEEFDGGMKVLLRLAPESLIRNLETMALPADLKN